MYMFIKIIDYCYCIVNKLLIIKLLWFLTSNHGYRCLTMGTGGGGGFWIMSNLYRWRCIFFSQSKKSK